MKTPKTIINIQPTFLRKAEALKYLGIGETLFKEMARENKLKVYPRGNKAVWYKVSELDAMIERQLVEVN